MFPGSVDFAMILHVQLFVMYSVQGQTSYTQDIGPSQDGVSNFSPSLAVVIGILCIMFALTFILLIYAKFCHRGGSVSVGAASNGPRLVRSASRFSGIDKTVIESLPFFRFSSLKGSKEGLECAVCLSRFEDTEILRLLPKCKHAFHINCVDQWLEKHSSCPLCRHKVSNDDPTIFTYSNSMRFLGSQSNSSDVELFVQREENRQGSWRFSIGSSSSSFRKIGTTNNKEQEWLIQEEGCGTGAGRDDVFDKLKHRIIVSDVVLKNRWSSASSSDLMLLNSEMLYDMSSNRFCPLDLKSTNDRAIIEDHVSKIKEEMEMFETTQNPAASSIQILQGQPPDSSEGRSSSSRVISSTDRRAVSEITAFSRFRNFGGNNTIRELSSSSSSGGIGNIGADRRRRLWLPIARRTVEWFANRETRIQHTRHTFDV